MSRVAFIGLGVMGFPMAGHLARAGRAITVYNRTAAKRERWLALHPGAGAATPATAAAGADFVFSCVGNDDDLRAVTLGPTGAFSGMKPGSIFVDHSTTSAAVARELSVAAAAQQRAVCAPGGARLARCPARSPRTTLGERALAAIETWLGSMGLMHGGQAAAAHANTGGAHAVPACRCSRSTATLEGIPAGAMA